MCVFKLKIKNDLMIVMSYCQSQKIVITNCQQVEGAAATFITFSRAMRLIDNDILTVHIPSLIVYNVVQVLRISKCFSR